MCVHPLDISQWAILFPQSLDPSWIICLYQTELSCLNYHFLWLYPEFVILNSNYALTPHYTTLNLKLGSTCFNQILIHHNFSYSRNIHQNMMKKTFFFVLIKLVLFARTMKPPQVIKVFVESYLPQNALDAM